jgi:hypothetical protein
MFLKSTNLPEIDQYPYYFRDLKSDNPNISFPENFWSQFNAELAEYSVYFVVDNPPELLPNQVIESKTPIYVNGGFEFEYLIRDKTPEEIKQESFNPVKFMEQLADNLLFQQWANSVKNELAFNLMMIAFQNKSLHRVQAYYNALKASYPLPENAITEWTEIAENNGINLTF